MLNISIFVGRLAKDVETFPTKNGESEGANFSIAVQRDFKNKETGNYDADFFNVQAFGGSVEALKKFYHKGDLISFEGRLQNNHYEEKDGHKQYGEKIIFQKFFFLGLGNENKKNDDKPKYDFSGKPRKNVPF